MGGEKYLPCFNADGFVDHCQVLSANFFVKIL